MPAQGDGDGGSNTRGGADIEANAAAGTMTSDPSPPRKPARPRPEPPECVKALQRCAARLDEWERKQADMARQREHRVSPPDKPEPLLQRFVTVPIVALILGWVPVVYLWRIVYPALAGHTNALATKGEGVGLCVGFCILWAMTIWSWIKAVIAQPGHAKEFVPQSEPPAPRTQAPYDPRNSMQEPVLYSGPFSEPPRDQGASSSPLDPAAQEPEPPGILSAALPIAPTATAKPTKEEGIFSTSSRSAGADTDITAVSQVAPAQLPKNTDKSAGPTAPADDPATQAQTETAEPSSPRFSQRTRSESLASSLTGLPPSPKPNEDVELGDPPTGSETPALAGPSSADQQSSAQTGADAAPRQSNLTDESDVMPGGLPAHAREYKWEEADGQGQRTVPPFNVPPQHGGTMPWQGLQPGANFNNYGRPPFLPVPQRYPNVVPLLAPPEDVPSRYCHWCKIVKPPRTHHCKKCGTCVLKMDHHCPWLAGCVGAHNYRYFLIFVMWVSALEVFVFVSNAVMFSRGTGRTGDEVPPERRWSADSFMISLFPICAIFSIFTLTLLSVHTYLIAFNLTTIEQLAYASRTNGEDAVLDGWMRQPLERRRKALEEFDRAGGWASLVRSRAGAKSRVPNLPLPATSAASSEEEKERALISKLRTKAESMLLMRVDYLSCGLFLPHKAFMRAQFLDGGMWGDERTEGNPWWVGGSAEYGERWERLCALYAEERAADAGEDGGTVGLGDGTADTRTAAGGGEAGTKEWRAGKDGNKAAATAETTATAEASNATTSTDEKRRARQAEIARLERHIRGRPAPLGFRLGAALANARQVFGNRPWEWFLPIGRPAHDGLSYPLNPRFGPDGARRPRNQWPEVLR